MRFRRESLPLVLLIALAAAASAGLSAAPKESDRAALLEYASLVIMLAALTRIVVPGATL